MSDLTILAIAQFPVVQSGAGPWNPASAVQPWVDPVVAEALAADPTSADNLAVYTTWRVTVTTGAVSLYQFGVPYSQAGISNVPPIGFTSVSGAQTTSSPNNVPIDPSQLKAGGKYAGYTIQPNPLEIFNAPPLLVPPVTAPAPVPVGTDPTEARILAGEEELLTAAHLPAV